MKNAFAVILTGVFLSTTPMTVNAQGNLTSSGEKTPELAGKFEGEWQGRIEPKNVDLKLYAQKADLTGVFKFDEKTIGLRHVKVSGNKLSFLVPIHPEGKVDGETLVFNLELTGNTLSGKMREMEHSADKSVSVTFSKKGDAAAPRMDDADACAIATAAGPKENFWTWQQKAEQGDAEAQYSLGMLYQQTFRPDSTEKAMKWFRLAAEQGHAKAQVELGSRYAQGYGVPQDTKEAAKWFRLAAEQGEAKAQYILGDCYERGRGVPQDYKEAVKWFRLAAEQGVAEAQSELVLYYATGTGVPQDYSQAYAWLNMAADQRSRFTKDEREEKLKQVILQQATPSQIKEGERLYREYAEKYSKRTSLGVRDDYTLSRKFWKTASVEDVNSAVANGADVNARGKKGRTVLMQAAPHKGILTRVRKKQRPRIAL